MATLAENLLQLNEAKQAIKTAIESKGQDLTDVPFPKYAEKIVAITGGGRKVVTGTVVFATDSGHQTITHNLGTIPSFFLLLVKDKSLNFTIGAEDAPKAGLYGFIFVKDAVIAYTFTGESIKPLKDQYGISLEWRNSGTTLLHWTSDTGNMTTDRLPTATTITTGYRSTQYKYLAGIEYEWIAIE